MALTPFIGALLLVRVQRAGASAQRPLVHGRPPREALAARFGADCAALSGHSDVASSALVGAECYLGTADDTLGWDDAWTECARLWDGARLASVRGSLGELAQRLATAGFDGDYRLALVRPYENESYWAQDSGTQPPQDAYTPLSELCTSAVTSKPSVYASGSCYVYMDEGAYPPSSWAAAVDKCHGHVPGYEGHAAWPTSAAARNVIPELVGGKHSDRMYWLGTKTTMPRTADAADWRLMLNSTHEAHSSVGELPAGAIHWRSGQPNGNFDEASAAYAKYDGSMGGAAVYDWHHDDNYDDRRQDAICEYREPKARPAGYAYAMHTAGKRVKAAYATFDMELADIGQCAALCHSHGVDRCRCFGWNRPMSWCRLTYLPCGHAAHESADAVDLHTLAYADRRDTTGTLNVPGGQTGRAKPDEPHRALCVKDAPKFATYRKGEIDGDASTAGSVLAEFAGADYAQGAYGGPQCAWLCMSTPGCGSFDHSAAEQKCTLYAGADANSAYAKSALDDA